MRYFEAMSSRLGDGMLKHKSKIVLAHAFSGRRRSVDELLENPAIAAKLADVRAIDDVNAMHTPDEHDDVVLYLLLHHGDDDAAGFGAQSILAHGGRRRAQSMLRLSIRESSGRHEGHRHAARDRSPLSCR